MNDFTGRWNRFREKSAADKKGLDTALSTASLSLGGDGVTVICVVPTATAEKEIEAALPKIKSYIRRKLNNYRIEIALSVDNTVVKEEIIYTPRQKSEYFAGVNPDFRTLLKELDLSNE